MSEPTYRVDVMKDVHEEYFFAEWKATVVRLSDDMPVAVTCAPSSVGALEKAQKWIMDESSYNHFPQSFFMDSTGQLCNSEPVRV